MILKVCVGSSCHLKGSYDVINNLKELLKSHNLDSRVELQASFCHGKCLEGVTAKIESASIASDINILEDGSMMIHRLSASNVEEVFVNKILPLVR